MNTQGVRHSPIPRQGSEVLDSLESLWSLKFGDVNSLLAVRHKRSSEFHSESGDELQTEKFNLLG